MCRVSNSSTFITVRQTDVALDVDVLLLLQLVCNHHFPTTWWYMSIHYCSLNIHIYIITILNSIFSYASFRIHLECALKSLQITFKLAWTYRVRKCTSFERFFIWTANFVRHLQTLTDRIIQFFWNLNTNSCGPGKNWKIENQVHPTA